MADARIPIAEVLTFSELTTHKRIVDPKEGEFIKTSNLVGISDQVRKVLPYDSLYRHQYHHLDALSQGESTIVLLPTAAGKSLSVTPYCLDLALKGYQSLMFFPRKALQQDQEISLERMVNELGLTMQVINGDVPQNDRNWDADIILTNEFCVDGALGNRLISDRLKFVWVDEAHLYAGAQGAHTAGVLRRLSMGADFHGNDLQFGLTSATVGEPGELFSGLTGKPNPTILNKSYDKRSRRTDIVTYKKSYADTLCMVAELMAKEYKGILFVDSVARCHELAGQITNGKAVAFFGKLDADEREAIIRQFNDGKIDVIVATSCLEVGVDLSADYADFVIIDVGEGGISKSSWNQRCGRVGRGDNEGLTITLLPQSTGDLEWFVNRPLENLTPSWDGNTQIQTFHLERALHEGLMNQYNLKYFPGAIYDEKIQGKIYTDGKGYWMKAALPGKVIKPHSQKMTHFQRMVPIEDSSGNRFGMIEENQAYQRYLPGTVDKIFFHSQNIKRLEITDIRDGKIIARQTFENLAKGSGSIYSSVTPLLENESFSTANISISNGYGRITRSTNENTVTLYKKSTRCNAKNCKARGWNQGWIQRCKCGNTKGLRHLDIPDKIKGQNKRETIKLDHSLAYHFNAPYFLVRYPQAFDLHWGGIFALVRSLAAYTAVPHEEFAILQDQQGWGIYTPHPHSNGCHLLFTHLSDIIDQALERINSCHCKGKGCSNCTGPLRFTAIKTKNTGANRWLEALKIMINQKELN